MMNKRLLLLMAWCPIMLLGQAQVKKQVMVIADPHVMAAELTDGGEAFQSMMKGQRKMLDISEVAFSALVDTALHHHPSVVLIPGDLTKDGEVASHAAVVQQITRLTEAGIKVLVIPGNHDIGGTAYTYKGANKVAVETLQDDAWESIYTMTYQQAVATDDHSHNYVAEPLPGVTVIGIDASHDKGEGSLSDNTLQWVLSQADAARAKGNMLIAMCHWQLMEHVDEGGVTMESGLLQDAAEVRDALMAHGVRLLLTGHMHVNSISTLCDTLSMSGDSIVEISTGAPITFPCPYRWLEVSADRSTVAVETDYLTRLPGYEQLTTYSESWMREHTMNIMPQVSVLWFDKAAGVMEDALTKMMQGVPMGSMVVDMMKKQLPQTEEEKIAIVNKYLAPTMVELYLLHSAANEPQHAEADSLAKVMYQQLETMIHDLTDKALKNYTSMQQQLIDALIASVEVPVQSLVEDRTHWASVLHSDQTDDLSGMLRINLPQPVSAVEQVDMTEQNEWYDVLGRRVSTEQTKGSGCWISAGRKVMVVR